MVCDVFVVESRAIRFSSSPFASPILLVKKEDATWRFCMDYRALNSITSKNNYPIPIVEDLFSEFSSSRFFYKVDLRSGYHQVRMKEGEEYLQNSPRLVWVYCDSFWTHLCSCNFPDFDEFYVQASAEEVRSSIFFMTS